MFSLAPTPPANAFVGADRLGTVQETIPLDLYFCRACAHVQLLDVVDPLVLFQDYVYVSGTSPVFVNHFREYASTMIERFPAREAFAFEIGSNDGTLLKQFQERGVRVLGIDPASKIAASAQASGTETLCDLFTTKIAESLASRHGKADYVLANNVFAHIDDLSDVARGIARILKDEGVFAFEVSYLVDVLDKTLFDTIYHEHLCYHSLIALEPFFKRHGLRLFDAERVGSHGGSLRGFVCLDSAKYKKSARVDTLLKIESEKGLDQFETFQKFGQAIERLKSDLSTLLQDLKAQGKTIAGFGAPAKATTLMHHFGISAKTIDFIVDDSPWKQGLYSPGLHVPVVPASAISEKRPDYLVVLAWNFADSIMAKHQAFVKQGGRFILPFPQVRVI